MPGSRLRRESLGRDQPDQVPVPATDAADDTPPECTARVALFKLALEGQAYGGRYVRSRSLGEPFLRAAVPEKNTLFTMTRATYYDLFDLR